jgi:hypothetical protein
MPPNSNGHASSPNPADACLTSPDPLAEAEALRAALADAAARAARLVAVLKHGRREKKAMASVWTSLRQLNLGPPGGRP